MARCFWLQFNENIKRPSGPMSTLPNGVDYTLKNYFDHWRKDGGLPPLLHDKLKGKRMRLLKDEALIAKFRSRSFGIFDKEAGAYFQGMLDDALELEDGSIIPLDNKTKGFPPGEEAHPAYGNQMSAYTLFLRENGIKTENSAYLVYWYLDHKHMDLERPLEFNVSLHKVNTNPDAALKTFREAVESLKEPMPASHKDCAFCSYRSLEP
ncbi:MAG: PD-(D/E)XK nuclease family protein [Candidatus Liptonbacteria bacterium]|nr:PD-(D/E)XK nuclease family protein [Candidatus Liptonbacteria bacterium]